MEKIIKLLSIITLAYSSFLFSESVQEKCNQQKEEETCMKMKIDSKSVCIWDNISKTCKVEKENRIDYKGKDTPFPFSTNDKKEK